MPELGALSSNSIVIVSESFDSFVASPVQIVIVWNGFSTDCHKISLLTYIEENKSRLKQKYVDWSYQFGSFRVKKQSCINDFLQFQDGFNLSWMSLIIEKSIWKSPGISNAIKLIALEEILLKLKPSTVCLNASDIKIRMSVKDLCFNLNIPYTLEKAKSNDRQTRVGLNAFFPPHLRAILSLTKYLLTRLHLIRSAKRNWYHGENSVLFCSYFFNIDSNSAEKGHFYTHYWKNLHNLLKELNLNTNWLHLYVPVYSSNNKANKWINKFNLNREEQSMHSFLDSFISLKTVIKVVRKYVLIQIRFLFLPDYQKAFQPTGSALTLKYFMGKDWVDSIHGAVAINNLLIAELFNKALNTIPQQSKGFYLAENQAWEKAFLFYWKKYNHGEVFAVPHSTRSFWDLRFSLEQSPEGDDKQYQIPVQDFTLTNGNAARKVFISENYPDTKLIACEALRYNYLERLAYTNRTRVRNATARILVLGDYNPEITIKMLEMLGNSIENTRMKFEFTLKPHPSTSIDTGLFPQLKLQHSTNQLEDLLGDFDIAYSSNKTSASADAYMAGLPIIIMLSDNELNLSPLLGNDSITFVDNADQLKLALTEIANNLGMGIQQDKQFFYLDSQLQRWRKILIG
jgi:surface carbohydrate biosynthesis protein (TIGR04326 family)